MSKPLEYYFKDGSHVKFDKYEAARYLKSIGFEKADYSSIGKVGNS